MDADRIKFGIKKSEGGFVVIEECYKGPERIAGKELGMVHQRKEEALKLMDSLVILTRQTSPKALIEFDPDPK
jgi:hypothetical protein